MRRQGNHKGALAEFRQAVALDPSDPNAQFNLGKELQADGDNAGAIAAFQKAIELKPDFEQAHYNLGIALRSQGDTAAARKAGMSEAMFGELMAVVGMANETNRLANGYRVPIDPAFE